MVIKKIKDKTIINQYVESQFAVIKIITADIIKAISKNLIIIKLVTILLVILNSIIPTIKQKSKTFNIYQPYESPA